jgi:hypothetical protein
VPKVMAARDPLAYITSHSETLMQRFRGWRKAERNRLTIPHELSGLEKRELHAKSLPRSRYSTPNTLPEIEDDEWEETLRAKAAQRAEQILHRSG